MPYLELTGENSPHFNTLSRGYNLRWPSDGQEPASVLVCQTEDDIINALTHALSKVDKATSSLDAARVTVRSGGHAYEGFVSNNPGGYIIDVGLYAGLYTGDDALPQASHYTNPNRSGIAHPDKTQIEKLFPEVPARENRPRVFKILPGTQNWDGYVGLFKTYGKTIPGGSCYSVGAGGHISGGGYGLLSRAHGLTTDHLTAVDVIIAPDGVNPIKVFASRTVNPDLFRMCAGAGGGNVGIITAFYFEKLPDAPEKATLLLLDIPWDQFTNTDTGTGTGGKKKFREFLQAYAEFFRTHDSNPEHHGLFTLLHVTHKSKPMSIAIQVVPIGGTTVPNAVLHNFVETLRQKATLKVSLGLTNVGHAITPGHPPRTPELTEDWTAADSALEMDWLAATQFLNDSGAIRRGKYKSAYLIDIPDEYADGLYEQLTGDLPKVPGPDGKDIDIDVSDCVVQIDSYGGAINDKKNDSDAVFQRRSVLKVQYHGHWYEPSQDDKYLNWFKDLYTASFKNEPSKTPFPYSVDPSSKAVGAVSQHYEGCYINYPDIDMVTNDTVVVDGTSIPRWLVLYYGKDLPSKLMTAKKKFDPSNIFRHQMSIPLPK